MEYKGCFDTVHGLIEDASKEFGAAFVVSPEKSEQVSRACEKVDALFEEIDCSVIDASVNMDNKVLTISIFCDEVILETVERIVSVSFYRKSLRSLSLRRQKILCGSI